MATLNQNSLTFNVQDAVPLPLKTKSILIDLANLTFESYGGLYIASVDAGLTSGNKILSVMMTDFSSYPSTDMILLGVSSNYEIGVFTSRSTAFPAGAIRVQVFYV